MFPIPIVTLMTLSYHQHLVCLPYQFLRKRAMLRRLRPEEHDHFFRYLAFASESAVKAMPEGIDRWVWILDQTGVHAAS